MPSLLDIPERVRFAPSPTGELHLGGARTALFNFLLAKKTNGSFIIRIEDTDQNRFVEGSADRLLNELAWLGITYDEGPLPGGGEKGQFGPYIQSQRKHLYQKIAKELLENGYAYRDFLTSEELHQRRTLVSRAGGVLKREFLRLESSEEKRREEAGEPFVIRLATPENGTINFNDKIKGKVTFDWRQIDDQVLLKSDGLPTYHLANVVDDHEMRITTVMRAEEWLPSTPKHLYLYKILGWDTPSFAHVPLIVNTDKSKMSKRKDGDKVWISRYRERGILPAGMLNYLALLGWHETGDREIYTLNELINAFDISRCQNSPAAFDIKKLWSINKVYLDSLTAQNFYLFVIDFLEDKKKSLLNSYGEGTVERLIKCAQGRISAGEEINEFADSFIITPYEVQLLAPKNGTLRDSLFSIELLIELWKNVSTYDIAIITEKVLSLLNTHPQLTKASLLGPVRCALSGKEKSVDPFTLLSVLPHEESLRRLQLAHAMIISFNPEWTTT